MSDFKNLCVLLVGVMLLAGCGEDRKYGPQGPTPYDGARASDGQGESSDTRDSTQTEPDADVGATPHDFPPFCEGLEGPVLGETPMGSFFRGNLLRTSTGSYEGVVLVRPERPVGYMAFFSLKVSPPYEAAEIAVYDRRDCKPMVADAFGRVFHQVQYTRAAGEEPGIYVRARSSGTEPSIPFELKVAPGPLLAPFCGSGDYDAIEPGQTVEGRLDAAVDPVGGPEGHALRIYTVELQRGQSIRVDYELLSGEPAQVYVFDVGCLQRFPLQSFDRETHESHANSPLFTASHDGTYKVLVNATGPGDSEYRVKLEVQ